MPLSARRAKRRALVVALALAALVPPPPCAAASDPAGRWEGPIQLPGMELRVLVELRNGPSGLEGTIDIPAQNAKGLALESIEVAGSAVAFAIRGIPGQPAFKGAL